MIGVTNTMCLKTASLLNIGTGTQDFRAVRKSAVNKTYKLLSKENLL